MNVFQFLDSLYQDDYPIDLENDVFYGIQLNELNAESNPVGFVDFPVKHNSSQGYNVYLYGLGCANLLHHADEAQDMLQFMSDKNWYNGGKYENI